MTHETIYGEDGPIEPHGGIDPLSPFIGVVGYDIGQWHPTADGSGKAEAVQMNMNGICKMPSGEGFDTLVVLRFKSADAVDALCRALLRSRKIVWPNEPVNVY